MTQKNDETVETYIKIGRTVLDVLTPLIVGVLTKRKLK